MPAHPISQPKPVHLAWHPHVTKNQADTILCIHRCDCLGGVASLYHVITAVTQMLSDRHTHHRVIIDHQNGMCDALHGGVGFYCHRIHAEECNITVVEILLAQRQIVVSSIRFQSFTTGKPFRKRTARARHVIERVLQALLGFVGRSCRTLIHERFNGLKRCLCSHDDGTRLCRAILRRGQSSLGRASVRGARLHAAGEHLLKPEAIRNALMCVLVLESRDIDRPDAFDCVRLCLQTGGKRLPGMLDLTLPDGAENMQPVMRHENPPAPGSTG